MVDASLSREVRHRLAVLRHVEEVTGNIAMTCRYYGISRQLYYGGCGATRTEGVEGLRPRSRAPALNPNATRTEVVGKIIYLRQNYHFGPEKIAMYLKRYHDVEISQSGVWRILKRLDMTGYPPRSATNASTNAGNATRSSSRAIRSRSTSSSSNPSPPPHRRAQARTTSTPPSTTAPGCGCCGSTRARPKDRDPVHRLRLPTAAVPSPGRANRQRLRIPVRVSLPRAGQRHRPRLHQAPHTPRLNGKVERSHRIDDEEFYRLLDGAIIDDAKVFQQQAPRVGGLLQLPSPPRRPRRPNPLRTTTPKKPRLSRSR